MNEILIPVADGSEELETVTIADLLARAGLPHKLVSCNPNKEKKIKGSRGIELLSDIHIDDLEYREPAMIILPGGVPGAETLRDTPALISLLEKQMDQNRWCAAICAAPALVLAHHNLLGDARFTCYPGFAASQTHPGYSEKTVVVDEEYHLVTSQGPGTAIEFTLYLIELLAGSECQKKVAQGLLVDPISL